MSSARKPSGFLKLHYDKLAMVGVIVLVLISVAILLIRIGQHGGGQRLDDLAPTQPRSVEAFDATPLRALADAIARPYQIPPEQRRMLVGEARVSSIPDGLPIPVDAQICPFTGTPQPAALSQAEIDSDGDGIPDEVERKHGLNPNDPDDALGDLDGDGFSNLEEYLASSNMSDPADFPPPAAKLRLVRTQVNPFKLRFVGTSQMPNGDVRYQLNLRSLERTYFVRLNETVEGFSVVSYDAATADGPTLVLNQGDKTIRLVQGRVRDEQAYTALLVFLVDGKPIRCNIGDAITLLDSTYKVVDILSDRVVIRDGETGRDIDIGVISNEERDRLSAGGG